MEYAALRDRAWGSVAHQQRLFGTHMPRAVVVDGDGWVASVVPSAADSPLLNAAVPLREGVVEDAVVTLEPEFAALRWGVWCDAGRRADEMVLRRRGFREELAPWRLMAAPLAELDATGPGAGERTDDLRLVGAVNDRAYGLTDGRLAGHFGAMPPGEVLGYRLDVDGRTVAVAAMTQQDFDAGVLFVATLPSARGRGHAGALMRRLLADAQDRGAATASLLATAMGAPLYARLGFRDLGAARLWQR